MTPIVVSLLAARSYPLVDGPDSGTVGDHRGDDEDIPRFLSLMCVKRVNPDRKEVVVIYVRFA